MSGIPIPSFRGVDATSKSDKGRDARNSSRIIPANWNVAVLKQLEVSLQHWFRKHYRNKSNSVVITLDDFFALIKRLDWSQTKVEKEPKAKGEKTKGHAEMVQDLTEEERLLHDLILASRNSDTGKTFYRLDDDGKLEISKHSVDQMNRSMSITTTINSNLSQKIQDAIKAHRNKNEKVAESTKKHVSNYEEAVRKAPKPVITADMTVDERVRARADAKRQHQKHLQEQSKKEGKKQTNVDHTWMIQLADALWTHARAILQRQNYGLPSKLASNSLLNPQASKRQRTSKKQQCVITFGDAIHTIAKSKLGEASAVQIAKALCELETYRPQWIVVMKGFDVHQVKPKNGSTSTRCFKWSKKMTTIFITPDNYAAVRSQLTGTPMPDTSAATLSKIVTSINAKALTGGDSNRKRPSPVAGKNLLNDFDISSLEGKRIKTSNDSDSKAKGTLSGTTQTPFSSPAEVGSKKREREDCIATATSATPAKPTNSPDSPSKRKKRLRINHNFILCDADHVGGEILPHSVTDVASPRGLKRLFMKLNEGKRI